MTYYSAELNSYHDGVNLAYDLKKFSKRNKLQLTYDPYVDKRIKEEEMIKKNQPYKKSIKDYFSAKSTKPPAQQESKDFEDEEIFNSVAKIAQQQKAVESSDVVSDEQKQDSSLVIDSPKKQAKPKQQVFDKVYLKRDALYKELRSVNVSVENSSTLEVIKDFLRNRICSIDNVDQLKCHTNYYTSLFELSRNRIDEVLAKLKPGDPQPNMQDVLSKVVLETFNDPLYSESLSEEDKYLLIKDLEKSISVSPNYSSYYQSQPQSGKHMGPGQALICFRPQSENFGKLAFRPRS